MNIPRIALVGERDLEKKAHQGIEASLSLFRRDVDSRLEYEWICTSTITAESIESVFGDVTGIWCTPGSPYENTAGALMAIQHARTNKKTFLGTCGGFQHALMEFSQNVLLRNAEHQELRPEAKAPLIVKLSCSLMGAKGRVIATMPERFSDLLGADESVEEFNCNYGVDRDLAGIFRGSDLEFVAHDDVGQIRAFRLSRHPFFVGTLFQPERRALAGSIHPVVLGFLTAAEPDATAMPTFQPS
jgi:CTP synthase (UTP-ammonia lyase)